MRLRPSKASRKRWNDNDQRTKCTRLASKLQTSQPKETAAKQGGDSTRRDRIQLIVNKSVEEYELHINRKNSEIPKRKSQEKIRIPVKD